MIKKYLRRLRKHYRLRLAEKSNRSHEQDVLECLREQGFCLGDKVMVHSSLSSIGFVEGGAKTLITAIQNIIGKDGLLVMPAFTAPALTLDYVKEGNVFSVRDSPSKMGAITEQFRTSVGVFRSIHPTHSLTAWGKNADQFVAGFQSEGRLFGKGTPFEKIKQLGFKVLLIGVDFENMTVCRLIEDLEPGFPIDPYMAELYSMKVLDELGQEYSMSIKVHNPVYSKKRKNMILYPYMKEAGKVNEFYLGNAKCMWLYVEDVYQTQLKLMRENIFTYDFETGG